jgi:hypothetical protein
VYNPPGIMLANLRALFGVVVDIVLLRRGPEHLPASPALLVVVVALYAGVASLIFSIISTGDDKWPLVVALLIVTRLAWYRVALQMSNKAERFTQTMTAMFALLALFAPLLMPIWNMLATQLEAKQTPSSALTMLLLALRVWLYVLDVRIVRSAFEWPWLAAVIMVLAQEFALILVALALFGNPAPAG